MSEPEERGEASSGVNQPLPSAPLRWWERLGAVALGLGSGGAGGYAVFATSNQAGAAALVLVGAAFLLIGVQGTRLVKLGGGGNSIEMGQYQAAAVRVIEHAKRENDAEISEGMVEAVAMINPSVASSPRAEARKYEDSLHQALVRIGTNAQREMQVGRAHTDFLVETGAGRRALIEVKRRSYGPLTLRDVNEAVSQAEAFAEHLGSDAGILVVTNAPLSGEVQDLNAKPREGGRPVEVISWNDERDDGILGRALVRVAR